MNPRLLLLTAALGGSLGPLSAQTLQYGLSGSLLASRYQIRNLSSNAELQPRLGGAAAAWLRQPLGRHLALQAELRYEARGNGLRSEGPLGWEGAGGYYTHREKSRLHYLTLPLLLRARAGKFFAEAGPQLSYLAAARNEWTTTSHFYNDPDSPTTVKTTEGAEPYRRWELGYAAGLGYELTPRLSAGLRYTGALTPLHEPLIQLWNRIEPLAFGRYVLDRGRNATLQLQLSYQLHGS